uniref:Uncharacterized protein n=1 Tax=Staphylococcus arlettae TaxID=29378 RepID=A0A1W5QCB4_9STAP|nr:hypothetical protein [Staphylococcus arlettae]
MLSRFIYCRQSYTLCWQFFCARFLRAQPQPVFFGECNFSRSRPKVLPILNENLKRTVM